MFNEQKPVLGYDYYCPRLLTLSAPKWHLAPNSRLMLTCPTPHNLSLPDTPAQLQVLTSKNYLQPLTPLSALIVRLAQHSQLGGHSHFPQPCVHRVMQALGFFPLYLKEMKQQCLLGGPVTAQCGQFCKFRNICFLRL